MSDLLSAVSCAAIAYVIGSVSFSYIFTKKLRHEDIRQRGSGNAGTTNVARNYGWKLGASVLACDVLKGVAAVLIGGYLGGDIGKCIAAVFVVAGHNYSCFLHFKGGKGIAATIGALLILQTVPTLIILAISVAIVLLTKIMSIGSIIGLILSVCAAFIVSTDGFAQPIAVLIIAILGIIGHKDNIVRLIHGNERKLSFSKK